jgi:hypothetical protein
MASWQAIWFYLGVAFLFGFAPGFALRLIVGLYPKGHPRRSELVAELYTVERLNRPTWVFEQLEVALFEGVAARRRDRRKVTEAADLKRRAWRHVASAYVALGLAALAVLAMWLDVVSPNLGLVTSLALVGGSLIALAASWRARVRMHHASTHGRPASRPRPTS